MLVIRTWKGYPLIPQEVVLNMKTTTTIRMSKHKDLSYTQESNKKIKCENMNLNVQEVRDLGTNPSPITIHF